MAQTWSVLSSPFPLPMLVNNSYLSLPSMLSRLPTRFQKQGGWRRCRAAQTSGESRLQVLCSESGQWDSGADIRAMRAENMELVLAYSTPPTLYDSAALHAAEALQAAPGARQGANARPLLAPPLQHAPAPPPQAASSLVLLPPQGTTNEAQMQVPSRFTASRLTSRLTSRSTSSHAVLVVNTAADTAAEAVDTPKMK